MHCNAKSEHANLTSVTVQRKLKLMHLTCLEFTKYSCTIELSSNSKEFGRVLLVTPSMFSKLEVHASEVVWRFEPITFYMRELRGKLILAPHAKLKSNIL